MPNTWLSNSDARLKDYGNSGGYQKDYAIEKIFKYMDLSENYTNISTLISDLQMGYAVSLSLGWINEDERNSGHSVTCWGYVTNNDYSENEKEHYEALIISDSDYSSITAAADTTNTGTYTPIEKGENSLKDGEIFAFKIVNISTVDSGDNTVRYSLHATREDGTDIALTDEQEITVNFGEESEVFTVTSWNTDEVLSGEYNISVFVNGSFGSSEYSLGSLKFEEEHFLTVNTNNDIVDKYDGKISLREAVEYSKEYNDENKSVNDLTGRINVYGSYIGTTDTLVKTDDASTIGEKESIFRTDTEGNTQWFAVLLDLGYETLHYISQLKSEAKNGFKVSVESGKLVYFDNEENKYITDIDSVFDENDYTVDEMGNDRAYYFGSFAVEPEPLYGDINGDEITDIKDAVLLQKYLNNEETLTDKQIEIADINYDENVDIKDVTYLQKYIAEDFYYPTVD